MPDIAVKKYELMLLLSPALSEDDAKEHIASIKKDHIEPAGGTIGFEDFWGRKTLAYPIKKETAAVYHVLHFEVDGSKLAALDEDLRLDNKVLRHLITIVSDKVAPMTLEQIIAWNAEHLPQEQRGKKNEEKRAPRSGKKPVDTRPEMQPATPDDFDDAPIAAKEKKTDFDKSRLDAELNEMLEDI